MSVLTSRARFRLVVCGRRWGKTRLGAVIATIAAAHRKRVWWVAPTYTDTEVGWREIRSLTEPIGGREAKGIRTITLPGGGFVARRSADRESSLRSEGLDLIILDECAFMERARWEYELRYALTDRRGGALFITTPDGMNWIHDLWVAAEQNPDWQRWQMPTWTNPLIHPDEVEDARQTMATLSFDQELGAEFVARKGMAFPDFNLKRHVRKLEMDPGRPLCLGLDYGYQTFAWVLFQWIVDTKPRVSILADGEWHNLTTEQAMSRLKEQPWSEKVAEIGCDPAGNARTAQGIADVITTREAFPRASVRYSSASRHRSPEWRASRLRDMLWSSVGGESLLIDPKATATIKMLTTSRYVGATPSEPEKDGIVDHIRDALGYGLVNTVWTMAKQGVERRTRPW